MKVICVSIHLYHQVKLRNVLNKYSTPLVFPNKNMNLNMSQGDGLDFMLTWRAGAHRPL